MRDHELGADQQAGAKPRTDQAPQDDRTGLLFRAAAGGRASALGAGGLLGLQRAVGNAAVGAALEEESSPVHDVVASGGNSLDADVRSDMETRLGHDFGDVRVHTDAAAHDSAKAVNAHAYTVGSHIVFQRDAYDPGSHQGRTTLAHELTHVVQQRSGPVDGTAAPGGIAVSDPGDRFEREAAATADRAMAEPAPAPAVQREAAEDEEETPVQGLFVQRAEAEDEEETPA
ncbi:DUF4157 domain-containing protein [Kitasatospora sp. NPDC094028]